MPIDSQQKERDYEIRAIFTTHGNPEQVVQEAITCMRILHVKGYEAKEVFLDGKKLEDDFSDDKGEMWHTLDWKNHSRTDEGLHPDVT